MAGGPTYGEQLPGGPVSGPPLCPRDGNVSYVMCQRCGRPTCPNCQRPASVGIQCVDCAKTSASNQPRTVAGARLTNRQPVITQALIAINLAVYALQLINPNLVNFGLFVPIWGAAEPWRFLTAAFLHSGLWHIGFNMYALYLVGPSLELVLGRARYLTLYLLAALGGSVMVLLLADPLGPSWRTAVVGASGAVFGLFGALALTMRRLKRSDSQILLIIALNVVLGFVIPGISWEGHLGGLLTGGVLAGAFLFAPPKHRTAVAVAASIAVFAALVLASLVKYGLV